MKLPRRSSGFGKHGSGHVLNLIYTGNFPYAGCAENACALASPVSQLSRFQLLSSRARGQFRVPRLISALPVEFEQAMSGCVITFGRSVLDARTRATSKPGIDVCHWVRVLHIYTLRRSGARGTGVLAAWLGCIGVDYQFS